MSLPHIMSMPQPVEQPVESHQLTGTVSVFDRILGWFFVFFFALFPIFVLPMSWITVAQSKALFVAGMVFVMTILWILGRLLTRSFETPQSMLLYASALLPAAYAVATLANGWRGMALVGQGTEQDTLAAVILAIALLFLSFSFFSEHKRYLAFCLRALVCGSASLFIIQILFVFFPEWLSFGGVLTGSTANIFGSWHDLGIIAGLSLFLAGALFYSPIFAGMWRAPLVILGIGALSALTIIHFQDVFWGTGAMALCAALAVFRAAYGTEGVSLQNALFRTLPWVLLALLLMAGGFFATRFSEVLPGRLNITEIEVRPSWQGTFDIAKESFSAPESFVFGIGPNSFLREWGMHKPQSVNLTPFWNTDFATGIGFIPTSIFAVGLFGVLAWGAIMLVVLGYAFRFLRERRPLSAGRTLFGVLLVVVLYLLVFLLLYTPGGALTTLTFLLLGMLGVVVRGDAPRGTLSFSFAPKSLLAFLCIAVGTLAVFVASFFVIRTVVSNILVNRSVAVFRAGNDSARAELLLERALMFAPQNDRAHRALAELGIIQLRALLAENPQEPEKQTALRTKLEETIQHGFTAVQIDGNYQNWLGLAQVYVELGGANVEGALDEAKRAYEEASKVQPRNPTPQLRLAQIAAIQNDRVAARQHLTRALELKPDLAAALFLLSQLEAAEGNGDAAVQAAFQVTQLVRSDPLGWFNLGYLLYRGALYADAAIALEQAVTLAPDYANAFFILALSYAELGRTPDAIRILEGIASLNPGEVWLEDVIRNIRAGKSPFSTE